MNNKEILTKVKPLFDKYMPLYKYLIGYAWLSFVIEENINRTNTNKNKRFIFDIETASKLPVFPFCNTDLK